MTSPAFTHLITLEPPKSDAGLSLDHHLNEVREVAMHLRNERAVDGPQAARRPNRLRLAIGSALLNAGSALVASPSRRSTEVR